MTQMQETKTERLQSMPTRPQPNPNRVLYTYRAEVTKEEEIRYISHLDYADMMQRAICRAKLPAAYSEGFNPHMKIAFASALAVGVTSDAEYMDFEMTKALAQPEVFDRLRAALPKGARLLRLKLLTGKHKALMAEADEGVYEITLPQFAPADKAAAERAVTAFNAATEAVFHRVTPKKTRDIEVKQYMAHPVALSVSRETGAAVLRLFIRITPSGSIKPIEVLSLLCASFGFPGASETASIHRTGLLSKGKPILRED